MYTLVATQQCASLFMQHNSVHHYSCNTTACITIHATQQCASLFMQHDSVHHYSCNTTVCITIHATRLCASLFMQHESVHHYSCNTTVCITIHATQQCASLFMQPKIVSIFFTAFRQFRVVTMASVHASQDVWFLHSCSEWCHCLGPEQNASCARQSHAVISKFFFQLWKYMKIFHRVFFIYCLWKRISANTQTSGNTKESLPIHRHPVIQSIILSDKHCSSFPPSDMYVGSQLSGPC